MTPPLVKAALAHVQFETIHPFLDLASKDAMSIEALGPPLASALIDHRALQQRPIATAGSLAEATKLTPATVKKALAHLTAILNGGMSLPVEPGER